MSSFDAHTVREVARAKVNLDLRVVGRREDGYHELDSVVAFADFGDHLRFLASDELSLGITGLTAKALEGEPDNLVLRAARRLADHANTAQGAQIMLDKNLPVAAGLGGGSADAAATLRGLNRLWQLDLPLATLAEIGLELGADIPACLHSRSLRMGGIGETITPIALPRFPAILAHPGLALSTKAVFRTLHQRYSGAGAAVPPDGNADAWIKRLRQSSNDLELPAIELEPTVARVRDGLAALPGCRLARMSGSGATCFGLFTSDYAARAGADSLRGQQPHWWLQACTIGVGP
ncbi:MAG: 4-(cytidine 5'-diphospho)-2-C-methyl-D-erythritol kinase [Geminicoccaceae bacterium]